MAACLAVVGDLVEDVVVWPDGPVQRGTDTPARVFRSRGGSAANVAVAAAPYVPTRFLGCVGDDPLGDRLVADAAACRRRRRASSAAAAPAPSWCWSTPTASAPSCPTAARPPTSDRSPADVLDDVAAAARAGVRPARRSDRRHACAALLRPRPQPRRPGQPRRVVRGRCCASSAADRSARSCERVRPLVLFANADEARELDLRRPAAAASRSCVKDGAEPTTVLPADGPTLSVPVQPVEGVRDSTGAGDAFAAGWLSARMEGLDAAACVQRAHALARGCWPPPAPATPAVPGGPA